MKYTAVNPERESNSKNHTQPYITNKPSKIMKYLLLLIVMGFMTVAGVQFTPATQASAACDIVCTQYTDPATGQCYLRCCPVDDACKIPCEIKPCKN